MIKLENVSKTYQSTQGPVRVLSDIDLKVLPGERRGILGQNGAGKSTLVRLISGSELPTTGNIHRHMSVSWPLAFGGAFLNRLTGFDNFRFICRLYNIDPAEKVHFVEEFAELGKYFREPLSSYSAGMRARLAFAVSMAVEFDCFLIDEIIAVGDSRFQAKCYDELFVKRADRALLIVSHQVELVKRFCTTASVLENGSLLNFTDIDGAYEFYDAQQSISGYSLVAQEVGSAVASDSLSALESDDDEHLRSAMMVGRSTLLAEAFLSLPQEAAADEPLSAIVRSLAGELQEFSTAIEVLDILRGRGAINLASKVCIALGQLHKEASLYHVVMGDLWLGGERTPEAIAAYRTAVEIDPNSFWALRNLAVGLFELGCYADALPLFESAAHLSTSASLTRELARYIIDCCAYLDRPAPREIFAKCTTSAEIIEDVDAVHFTELGLLRVKVQGYCREGEARQSMRISLYHGDRETHYPINGLASNSVRRHAAFLGIESFGCFIVLRQWEPIDKICLAIWNDTETIARRSDVYVRKDSKAPVAGCDPAGDPAVAANTSLSVHDPEAAVLFGSLALAEGAKVNIEGIVEAQIALGCYSHAENLLATWPQCSLDHRLFDLFCVEIARSRLPGWKQRISELIDDRFTRNDFDAGGLTNLGHLQVEGGRFWA